jgi:4-aminobutyrate aminotransferase-like enzyme
MLQWRATCNTCGMKKLPAILICLLVLSDIISIHCLGIVTVSVGHSHPYVNNAAIEQIKKLQHTTTIYLHPNIAEFGKKLASTFPKESDLKVCYFVNSGSEANDLALLMARLYTGSYDVLGILGLPTDRIQH